MANTVGLNYLPILHGDSDVVNQFCIANAKSYHCLYLQPQLSHNFLHNICQGALASNTFLEIKDGQYLSPELASLICNYVSEAKCIIEKRELFNLTHTGKNSVLPSFNVAVRMPVDYDFTSISNNLKVNYRAISVPEIPISLYINCVCDTRYPESEK